MKVTAKIPFGRQNWIPAILFICFSVFLNSTISAQMAMKSENDPEQQQLEWCFIYSNLLGYDISYVNNPRLYDNLSQWMGTPYKYAGQGKNGIDCSGLVCRLIQDSYNISIAGSSKDLFKETEEIKKKELREGDLVFFKIRKGRISHVGVYLGKNKFVHASSSSGVIISDLDEPYYEKYYYSAGRLFN